MNILGERLRKLRIQKDISQEELGNIIGVHKMTISHWERGTREPNIEAILALCDYFNVSTEFLTGQSDITMRFVDEHDLSLLSDKAAVPLYGSVSAGNGVFADENIEDYIEISPKLAKTGEFFALRIKGDSMQPDIHDGDRVVVRQQTSADDGDIVIAIVNGDEGFCKKLKIYEHGIALISSNPKYDPMFFSSEDVESVPVKIIGVVKELRRQF